MPKTVVPGVGYLIYCQDTESNVFGILQGGQVGSIKQKAESGRQ